MPAPRAPSAPAPFRRAEARPPRAQRREPTRFRRRGARRPLAAPRRSPLPAARPRTRKGLIALLLSSRFKRNPGKPKGARPRLWSRESRGPWGSPGREGERAARPAVGIWKRAPAAAIFPLGSSSFRAAASWHRKRSVFHVRFAPPGEHWLVGWLVPHLKFSIYY